MEREPREPRPPTPVSETSARPPSRRCNTPRRRGALECASTRTDAARQARGRARGVPVATARESPRRVRRGWPLMRTSAASLRVRRGSRCLDRWLRSSWLGCGAAGGRREGHHEPCAAGVCFSYFDLAAVRADDVGRYGEPDPTPGGSACCVTAPEPLEHASLLVGGDARAAVSDGDPCGAVGRVHEKP